MTVNNLVDEVQAETVSDLLDAQMLVYFKSGLRFIPSLIRSRLFLAEDELSLAAGQSSDDLTDLSPAFVRERNVWYLDSNGDRILINKPPSLEYFHSVRSTSPTGKPYYYRIAGQTIYFDTQLDETITWGMDYFKEMTTDIALSDTFEGDEQLAEAAKCFCKSEFYTQYDEDLQKGAIYERKGKEIITRLDEEYTDHEFGGMVEDTGEG